MMAMMMEVAVVVVVVVVVVREGSRDGAEDLLPWEIIYSNNYISVNTTLPSGAYYRHSWSVRISASSQPAQSPSPCQSQSHSNARSCNSSPSG